MKYKAVNVENENNGHKGKWAVGQGKKYFLNMVYDTKEEALEAAAAQTIRWHYDQILKAAEVVAEVKDVHWAEVTWQDYVY